MEFPIDPKSVEFADIGVVAADWIRRRDAGMTSPERNEFRRWLAADPRHRAAFAKLNSKGDDCDWMWHAGVVDEVVKGLEQRQARRRQARKEVALIGAAAIAILGAFYWNTQPPSGMPMAQAHQESLLVFQPKLRPLPDGSQVELKSDAQIEVNFDTGARRVHLLSGEAFFKVAKDQTRPFIVTAGGVDVCAVGTEFSVNLASASVDVMVKEGTVAVGTPSNPLTGNPAAPSSAAARTLINHGNRTSVMANEAGTIPIEPVSDHELAEKLSWRIPRMEFTNTPLRNVLAKLAAYNRTRAVLENPDLGDLRISGVLRVDRMDSLLEMLVSDFDVCVERTSSEEILLRLNRGKLSGG